MQDNVFQPAVLSIPAGTTVVWRWGPTGNLHNVTGDAFASPSLTSGTFSRPFDRAGTYFYRCTIHPHMVGEIDVH